MSCHSVYIDCLDKSIQLQQRSEDQFDSLKNLIKDTLFTSAINGKPSINAKDVDTIKIQKNESISIKTHFLFDILLDTNDKVVYDESPNKNAIFNAYFFDNSTNEKSESDDFINSKKYTASELKSINSNYKKETKPLLVFIVEKKHLSEIGELLSKINNKNRVFLVVHEAFNDNLNSRLYGKLLGSLLNKIQKKYKSSDSEKQFHVLAYKTSDILLGIYLSQKGVNSNITSAMVISKYFNEFDLFADKRYLRKDYLTGEPNSEVGKYRIKTPMLLLSAIDDSQIKKADQENVIKDNTNPWFCQTYKSFKDTNKINSACFAEDINNWISLWKNIDAQDPYDINLDIVDMNWIYGKKYKSTVELALEESDKEEEDEEEDVNNIDEQLDDYNFSEGYDDEDQEYDDLEYDENGNRINILGNVEFTEFTRDDLSDEQKLLEAKFDKLKIIIDKTLSDDMKIDFKTLKDYFQFLTYCLFLEEMFSQQICEQAYIKCESNRFCTLFISTQESFNLYVPEEMHHLKKHAFVRGQPIFIMRKSDAKLNWKKVPQYWIAYVSSCDLCHFDKKGELVSIPRKARIDPDKKNQITVCNLLLYDWNPTPFPKKESLSNFAYLPGNIVLGRTFDAMDNITNPMFQNLILSKKKIKSLVPQDFVKNYYSTLNDSQKDALNSVLGNDVTIIKGPPGTGKTSTIYETVLQLLDKGIKPVMVVASSNLAVDNIAEKMVDTHADKIVRVTSNIREKDYAKDHKLGSICLHNIISDKLSPEIKDIKKRFDQDPRSIDSKEFETYLDFCDSIGEKILPQKDVIFSTTATIGNRHIKKLNSISVIIMDEATQSSEPLTLIALAVRGCSKIVLVGDPEQLSVFTRVKSLETSLFERVLNNKIFAKPFLLDTQYRMHPAISEFPGIKFYDNKLKDGLTEQDRKMKKVKFPVFYYDHRGIHAKESRIFSINGEDFGYSWINKAEVGYIVEFVETLIRDRKVKPSDIGVMTGYSAQRELLIQAFKKNPVVNPEKYKIELTVDKEDLTKKQNITVCDINGLIVASVDAFQGREKNIIVMSCVRSNDEGNIGFMTDERRMNVALTRAKYSLVLCGNAKCFSKNKVWGEYINSLDKKGYVRQSIYDF
jgi:hypothetical protein